MTLQKVSYTDSIRTLTDRFNLSVDEITRLAEVFEGITPASIGAASTEELTALSNSVTEITGTLATKQELTDLAESIDMVLDTMTDETAVKETTLNAGTNTVASYVKSPVNVKRIDGNSIINYAPPMGSMAWSLRTGAVLVNPAEIQLTVSGDAKSDAYFVLEIGKYTTYTLSYEGDAIGHLDIYTDAEYTRLPFTSSPFTFNLANYPNANRLGVAFSNYVAGQPTKTIKKVSLVEGSVAKPFVANIKGLTNPTIVNEANGTSMVIPTTLHNGEYVEQNTNKELVKYKKFGTLKLDDKLDYKYRVKNADGATVIEVVTKLPFVKKDESLSVLRDHFMVKYDGTIMIHGTVTKSDRFNNVDTVLAMSIPIRDSGWGANYQPTVAEIRAFLLGWKMFDATGGKDLNTGALPYNGTGTKSWQRFAEGSTKFLGLTASVPTTMNVISSVWDFYRLEYELNAPVQETVQPHGDLTMEKGDNSIKLYSGRIINEYNKPFNYNQVSGSVVYDRFEINTIQDNLSSLKFNTAKILNVYENGEPSSGWLYELTVQNYARALRNSHLHDALATYTVDYDPMYTWQVTAPISSVTVEHYETLQSVTNQVLKELEGLGRRASRASQLVGYLMNHTNEVNPHSETKSRTIIVGPNSKFVTLQSAIDSLKKNMGGCTISIVLDPGYYPEYVRVNGFHNGYLIIHGADANNRSVTTIDQLRVSYCQATVVVNHLTITIPSVGNAVAVVNCDYVRLYNSAMGITSVGNSYGLMVENANVMADTCDIRNFGYAVHAAVGATAYIHQCTGTGNTTGLGCYGGAVIAKSGTVPGHTTTAEIAWAGGVIR